MPVLFAGVDRRLLDPAAYRRLAQVHRLNQVERWFGLLTQRQLRRGAHTSVAALKQAITDFIAAHNGAEALHTDQERR